MLDSASRTRFEEALASGSLETLGNKLKTEGLSQVAIYLLFESFWTFLGDSGREAEADTVYDYLDWVWGWCSAGGRLFENCLTNEEVHVRNRMFLGSR
jgi:hypothetical protein